MRTDEKKYHAVGRYLENNFTISSPGGRDERSAKVERTPPGPRTDERKRIKEKIDWSSISKIFIQRDFDPKGGDYIQLNWGKGVKGKKRKRRRKPDNENRVNSKGRRTRGPLKKKRRRNALRLAWKPKEKRRKPSEGRKR